MIDIQKSILSTAILYEDLRYLIFGELHEKHFNNEFKTVFKVMKKLYNQRQDIDPVVILTELGQAYKEIIVDLSDVSFIKPNIKQYIKILKNDYCSNEAIKQTEELLFSLKEKRVLPEEAQDKYIEISKLFNSDGGDYRSHNMTDVLTAAFNSYNLKEGYYKTGFSKLDNTVMVSPGDFIIIGGRPSSGKTTFSTNIMPYMAIDKKVLFFSIETNEINIANKLISSNGKIALSKILNKDLTDEEMKNYLNTSSKLMKSNLEIVESGGITVNQIITKSLQRQADIIFIDYLQLINSDLKNNYERVTRISNELHMFAQKEKVTVFGLSQLRRPEAGRKTTEPTMSDLRESGALEQDADAVILLYDPITALSEVEQAEKRKDITKQERNLIVAKNKQGRIGKLNIVFYSGIQKFYEI